MKKFVITIAALLIGSAGAWAGQNFEPANRSGSEPAAEYSEARVAKREKKTQAERVPGFWDKEFERSGLKKTGDGIKEKFSKIGGGEGNFMQEQERKYRERHPESDTK